MLLLEIQDTFVLNFMEIDSVVIAGFNHIEINMNHHFFIRARIRPIFIVQHSFSLFLL